MTATKTDVPTFTRVVRADKLTVGDVLCGKHAGQEIASVCHEAAPGHVALLMFDRETLVESVMDLRVDRRVTTIER
jgi:hypothetical protein